MFKVKRVFVVNVEVNPEQIFNILEAKVVNEYGKFLDKEGKPIVWNEHFKETFNLKG